MDPDSAWMRGSKRRATESVEDFAEGKWMDDKGDWDTEPSQNPKTRRFSYVKPAVPGFAEIFLLRQSCRSRS
jgi:hypothetical protein